MFLFLVYDSIIKIYKKCLKLLCEYCNSPKIKEYKKEYYLKNKLLLKTKIF